jgi:hypothetical protein
VIVVKIEVEIPDGQVKFIKALQRWEGKKVDVNKYITDSIAVNLGADMEWMHIESPRKLEKLVWDLRLYEIYPSRNALRAQNPADKGNLRVSDEKTLTQQTTEFFKRMGLPVPAA